QNINLTSAGLQNSGIISSSNSPRTKLLDQVKHNPLSQGLLGGNQSPSAASKIQTPNGPILAFAPSQTNKRSPATWATPSLPMHGVMATGPRSHIGPVPPVPHTHHSLPLQQSVFIWYSSSFSLAI
ncbi:hypothetical protein JTE90_020213, partial [Oedothorax gibbosus]